MNTSSAPSKLLVIDDCDANLVFVRYMLTALGADFDIARSEADAEALMDAQDYGAVMIDHQAMRVNALDILARIRARSAHQPVTIVTTADPSRQTIVRFFEAGCDHFVHRPLTAKALCRVIPNMLFTSDEAFAMAS
ncbi:response regulator [Asticcacaulis machinosus]|uniref:Response regulator n=1 Tax=Asticcacaulis machinosus TaxID=2984211 RepID=A0ABT5HIV1_9CAUL|nr:response regulator [Asticcacaulis machinosus]MDC7676075.1 response regulator [Asticcacaulis machinosus]